MTKTEELTQALIAALDASPLGRDEKVVALGMARAHVGRQYMGQLRVQQHGGLVGTGKKNEELRKHLEEIEAQKKKSSRKKR